MGKNSSKNSSKTSQLYIELIKYFAENSEEYFSLKIIQRDLRALHNIEVKSLNSINYWVKKFREEGLIEEKLFILTNKGKRKFKTLARHDENNWNKIRGHNFQVKLSNITYLNGFELFKEGNKDLGYTYKISNNNYEGLKIIINENIKITFYKKIIYITFPEIFGHEGSIIEIELINLIIRTINIIQEKFKEIKFIEGIEIFQIVSKHVAITNSYFARNIIKKNGYLGRGKYLEIDKSKGVPELETVSKFAFEHLEQYATHIEKMAEENMKLKEENKELEKKIKKLEKNAQKY